MNSQLHALRREKLDAETILNFPAKLTNWINDDNTIIKTSHLNCFNSYRKLKII